MNNSVILKNYIDSDAGAVARMWEESRDGWPPGFFGSSETTADSVRQEERSSGGLFTVLAVDGDRVVGYCRTTPYGGESDAAYVALLNAVPDMHGKKIGKNLLLDAIKRSAKQGYYRIDLHTWPANLKAMPLYKKTGFFWVPDSMVYMQNYMPFLLNRPEFREFLGDNWWYDNFQRELKVSPDEERTSCDREVFSYVFRNNGQKFKAVFDRTGRLLSALDTPGFSVGIEKSENRIFFNSPVDVSLCGTSLPDSVSVSSDGSLSAAESFDTSRKCFSVTAEPVRVTKTARDRAPRVTVEVPSIKPLEIGLGFRGEEAVSMVSPVIRLLSPGQTSLELDLKKLVDTENILIRYAVNDLPEREKAFSPVPEIFQSCTLPLPDLENGVHKLRFRFIWNDNTEAEETVVLVVGPCAGDAVVIDTRRSMIATGRDIFLEVNRRGAFVNVWGRSMNDRPRRLGFIRVAAGPPVWNSDLPLQVYDLDIRDGAIHALTDWPSRPGMKHGCSFRLDSTGFLETVSFVENNSESDQKVLFRISSSGGYAFEPRTDIIPLKEGMHIEPRIYNQVPDWTEDLPKKVSELGAPWIALTGPDVSLMSYFKGWPAIQYDCPETGEMDVAPGETFFSPLYRLLICEGGLNCLLRKARSLGWELGNTGRKLGFPEHTLKAVMAEGAEVSLTHNLLGVRKASVSTGGEELFTGTIRAGTAISGILKGKGPLDVDLDIAGRSAVIPILLVPPEEEVTPGEHEDGILSISNSRFEALIDPSEFGHVFSLKVDDCEYLMASHPGPGDFAWEKPWFGGILPRKMNNRNNPFRLDECKPEISGFERETCGLIEKGWELVWNIDHKKYGSLRFVWKVSALPGVPVLRTLCCPEATAGVYPDGEFDVRGFLQPGGEHENTILTCQADKRLRQGRKHSGTWMAAGSRARVESPGKGFVEAYSRGQGIFFSEDYADKGSHLAVFCDIGRQREIEIIWLFGDCRKEDEKLSEILRFHHS